MVACAYQAVKRLRTNLALARLLDEHSSLEYAGTKVVVIVGNVTIIVSMVCDFIATAAMWYFLDAKGVTKTRGTIMSIRLLVLNRGLLLLAAQITFLVLWLVGETHWYWLPFHMNIPNIYTNTMLLLFVSKSHSSLSNVLLMSIVSDVRLNERSSIRAKEKAKEMLSLQLTSGGQQLQFNIAWINLELSAYSSSSFSIAVALMSKAKHEKVFPPLESDPQLFTLLLQKLGASSALHFEDVLSLDDPDLLALIQGHIVAFVLISSSKEGHDDTLQLEESQRIASMSEADKITGEGVMWVKQTIHNACGFYALLHAVCNIPSARSHIAPGSVLDAVLNARSVEERKKILETSKALDDAYIPIALQGQTAVSEDWVWEPPFHYVCFVDVHGRVWELNGARMGPVDRGGGREVVDVVRECIKEKGGTHSLLALVETVA
ncbi:hypothetical protein SERLA73DRAFT_152405 [Serpula lacrymans var. lacrymans S7.3]|uniref:Ubiquitin carboxyl-terminal hydrolase n=1 Tax=Serpula lacrymans var. lacrymans (strain S7.3) TaxID=936435 RepID=F8PU88_SERL3|nr:hypothetical protein SERLA73DRAFT_152405 [Serpula lacrymans var. lacrymans S7.3]